MSQRHVRYREIRFEVRFSHDSYDEVVEFYPAIMLDGEQVGRGNEGPWTAPADDPKLMSLAYGRAQASCDQENASLEDRGLNRVREVL